MEEETEEGTEKGWAKESGAVEGRRVGTGSYGEKRVRSGRVGYLRS